MFNKVKKDQTIDEKTIEIKRVSKKVKGGNNISFTALVVLALVWVVLPEFQRQ